MSRRFSSHRSSPRAPRRGPLALAAFACAAAGIASPARAADHYMVVGSPFFEPYRVGIVTVEVGGGKATGTLAPPAGDPRPALPVVGTLVDGILKVSVGSGSESYVLTFNEGERGLHQVWDEATTIGSLDPITLFRPQDDFSTTALALQHLGGDWCGQVYGGLAVMLRPEALKAQTSAPAVLADLDVVVAGPARGAGTAKLKDVWSRLRLAARGDEDVVVDIAVPVGTEAERAQALRAVPEVEAVGLPNACSDMAIAVVPRARLADGAEVSEAKLNGYLGEALSRLLSGQEADATGTGPLKFKLDGVAVTKDASGHPVFRAHVTADAEATRLKKGSIDQFNLAVMPLVTATDSGSTISLIPTVTGVKSARKSGPQLPPDAAFKPADDDAAVAISHRLVSWLAAAEDSRCDFLTQASFDEPQQAYNCANLVLDDVAQSDDN